MPKPIIDRRSSAVVTPPVIPGAYLTQSTMPTAAQAWAAGEAPTITFSTTPTVSGGSSILPTDSRIKHTGRATTGVVEASVGGYWRSPYMADKTPPLASTDLPFLPRYGAKVRTTSPVVEVKMKQRSDLNGKTGSTTRIPIMLKVNGQYVTRRPIYVGPGNIGYAGTFTPSFIEDGTGFYLRFAFGTSADRTIEVITMTEYGGFSIPSGYEFTEADAPRFRAVIIGDSLTGGEKHGQGNWSLTSPEGKLQHATYTHLSCLWAYACQTLGYDNAIVSSAGSSGFAISGDTVNYATASRVQNDAVALDPHLFVVGTPFNDIANSLGGGSVTPATVQANATSILNTLKSKVPNAIRVILGAPTPPVIGGASGASIVAPWNTALKAAALATGSWFIDPALGDLFNPAGTRVLDRANMIVGNEQYVSSDGTHPTQAGADFFGSGYIAEFLKACHPVGMIVTPTPDPDPTPTPDPDPGTPVEPTPTGGAGPHSVDYTPNTLPRTEKADRTFLAASVARADIRTAMVDAAAWADDNPTKDAEVTIRPGELVGSGCGSTSTAFIADVAHAVGANGRRIRVRPADFFGSLKVKRGTTRAAPGLGGKTTGALNATYGLRMLRVDGFAFSEIDVNESGILFSGCIDSALEYADNVAYWASLGIAGRTGANVDLTAIMYRFARIKNGDGAAIGTSSGPQGQVTQRNNFFAPIYIGEEATWDDNNNDGKADKPHSDQIQEKGNFPLSGWTIQDSIIYAAYNCVAQLGSQTNNLLTLRSYLLGQDDARTRMPAPASEFSGIFDSDGGSTFQIFNGKGTGSHKSRDTYAYGNMGDVTFANSSADVLTSRTGLETKTGWTKVTRLTKAQLDAVAPTPPPGTTLWATRS